MRSLNINGVSVQVLKEGNRYCLGFVFGFNDKRNNCGYFGGSLSDLFKRIRLDCNA